MFGVSRTHDALAYLYAQAAEGSQLSESVDAVSLAFLARHHRHAPLADLARSKYSTALRQVNRSLQRPQLATTDVTLQCVLLLDLYEKMVNSEELAPSNWMAHVNGALALASARGNRNFDSSTARRLGKRLVSTLVISCLAASARVPAALSGLCRGLDPHFPKDDIKWQSNFLVTDLINLQADVKEGKFPSDAHALAALWAFEAGLAAKHTEWSPSWQPVRVATDSPLVLENHYDLYRDHFVTQGANVFRMARLLLHQTVQEYAAGDDARPDVRTESRRTIEGTARAICASAPQFFLPGARPANADTRALPLTPAQVLECYAVLSPLYLAGQASADAALRAWVVATMRHMADAGGMEMARTVADILEARPGVPHWGVYAMLGSYAFAA